jgi:signal transduction histidine kinase
LSKRHAPTHERGKTDDSLRTERKKSDEALKGDRAAAARAADEVIDQARMVADAVLTAARVKADQQSRGGSRSAGSGGLEEERATADRVVLGERAIADLTLTSDRKERVGALEALLRHERAATDAYLLTERARSDDAVAHRDDFLGMVAHDLRNLLHDIILSLELLRMGSDEEQTSQAAAAATRIRRHVARMNRLIGDLVDVASIDAGKLAIVRVKGDVAALAAEATETFQPAALAQGISLSVQVAAGSMVAEFDHGRMLQVFANLIGNSLKFTPSGGTITVRVEGGRGMLGFSVDDTGVGIPTAMLETVFERFWQVGAHDRRGQGLGLYISKCIVEAHGGRIWAESEPGQGTRVRFTLPVDGSGRRGGLVLGGATRDASRAPRRRGASAPPRRRA